MPFKRRFDAVLFDLDGTLLDTRELIVESYQHAFRRHMGLEVTREQILARIGYTLADHFALYDGCDVAAMVETYRAHNLERHDTLTTIFPGVVETLEGLASEGCRLAVVSSKVRKTVLKGLDLFDLTRFFSVVVCLEDTKRHKPHPDPVEKGLALLGAGPATAVMVGDSPFDIASGRAAGTATAAVGWSSLSREELLAESPDYVLEALPELVEIVKGITFSRGRIVSQPVEK